MKLFDPKKQCLSYTIIAGGTDFARALAGLLSAQGDRVLAIAGDAADLHVLQEANMEKADTVVAATEDDNLNLLVAQLAREVFGVGRVIALLNDSGREGVYRALDVPTFSPALVSAKELIKGLSDQREAEIP